MASDQTTLSQSFDGMRLLANETRIQFGPVPRELGGVGIAKGKFWLSDNAFLLRTEEGLNFFYREGEGVVIEREPGCVRAMRASGLTEVSTRLRPASMANAL